MDNDYDWRIECELLDKDGVWQPHWAETSSAGDRTMNRQRAMWLVKSDEALRRGISPADVRVRNVTFAPGPGGTTDAE